MPLLLPLLASTAFATTVTDIVSYRSYYDPRGYPRTTLTLSGAFGASLPTGPNEGWGDGLFFLSAAGRGAYRFHPNWGVSLSGQPLFITAPAAHKGVGTLVGAGARLWLGDPMKLSLDVDDRSLQNNWRSTRSYLELRAQTVTVPEDSFGLDHVGVALCGGSSDPILAPVEVATDICLGHIAAVGWIADLAVGVMFGLR